MIVSSRLALLATGAACALLGSVGTAAWLSHHAGATRADTEAVVHDYLLAHPEVLPEALDRLRQQESQHGAAQAPALRAEAEKGWPGAVLGNPHGSVTLVEFTDFACGYCRRSVGDLARLTQANHELRIVVHELPILTPESRDAARMALAAAEQGRYPAFYTAMFAIGRPDAAGIAAAARAAGLDMTRARAALADPRLDAEIEANLDLARRLGFSGTPSWLVGNTLLSGAVGVDELGKAIAAVGR